MTHKQTHNTPSHAQTHTYTHTHTLTHTHTARACTMLAECSVHTHHKLQSPRAAGSPSACHSLHNHSHGISKNGIFRQLGANEAGDCRPCVDAHSDACGLPIVGHAHRLGAAQQRLGEGREQQQFLKLKGPLPIANNWMSAQASTLATPPLAWVSQGEKQATLAAAWLRHTHASLHVPSGTPMQVCMLGDRLLPTVALQLHSSGTPMQACMLGDRLLPTVALQLRGSVTPMQARMLGDRLLPTVALQLRGWPVLAGRSPALASLQLRGWPVLAGRSPALASSPRHAACSSAAASSWLSSCACALCPGRACPSYPSGSLWVGTAR